MAVLMLLLALGFSGITSGSTEYKGKEAWGYLNVRKDAYMFYWLYYTDVSENYSSYPLIIWLQGGPGASSSGYGNFLEIGPLDSHLKPRNTSWVKKANLLFIDNPVGSGFSYVTNNSALATNNSQIAADLMTVLSLLLQNIPEFQKSPLYIFGESYGGKMAVDFAVALHQAIQNKKIVCNFKGIALGDSWISPASSVASWGPYLYSLSLLTDTELNYINKEVAILNQTLANHQYENATVLFNTIQTMIVNLTGGVDFYNVLKHESSSNATAINKIPKNDHKHSLFKRNVAPLYASDLSDLMNGPIREKLHVIPKNVTWGGQSSLVFSALAGDFMKPVVNSVEYLLNETKLNVNVYSGQLDVIVDSTGTMNWIKRMRWPGIKQFMSSRKESLCASKYPCGFGLSFKNFHVYWILLAGHMVPSDAGVASLAMVDAILSEKS